MAKINFGQTYKGMEWSDPRVPDDYLYWYQAATTRSLKDCEEEIERREEAARRAAELEDMDKSIVEKEIAAYRRLRAKTAHSDVGGSDDEMRKVNQVHDFLLQLYQNYRTSQGMALEKKKP